LKKVDLPTFGRPTMATKGFDILINLQAQTKGFFLMRN